MSESYRIDFTGVSKEIRSGGRAAHIPEGDYLFKVISHEARKSERSGSRYFSWQIQCVSKPYVGKTIYHITSMKPEALWNLRNFIHACTGKNVGGRIANFKPQTLYGKIFAGTTEDDSYVRDSGGDNEREVMRSVLADIRPREELNMGDEDDDEEETTDEEEEEEDSEDEDDEEEPAPKPTRGKVKSKSKRSRNRDEDDDDEDDDDLEDIDVDEI
jgi:hypothetical protein